MCVLWRLVRGSGGDAWPCGGAGDVNLLKVPDNLTDDQVVLLSDVLPTAWCERLRRAVAVPLPWRSCVRSRWCCCLTCCPWPGAHACRAAAAPLLWRPCVQSRL